MKAEKEFIFNSDMLFNCCHASNLSLLKDGNLLATWFAGSLEGADDVGIWSSKRINGVWTMPIVIAQEEELPHWNPIAYTKEDGTCIVYYKVGRILSQWYTKKITSKDNGASWGEPVELVTGDRGGRGPVRNKIIVLSNGIMLAPGSTENGLWKSFVDISKDGGETWEKSCDIIIKDIEFKDNNKVESNIPVTAQSFKGKGVIQPTIWESQNGIVHAMLRSTEGRIYRSDSSDYGKTWSYAYPTSLPNNNSGIDVVKLNDNSLVLVYNPVDVNWGPRTPLQLAQSFDNGINWSNKFILESNEGEYSYPAIITNGKSLLVSYTWRREKIAFWEIDICEYFK